MSFRSARLAAKLTQRQVADALGVTDASVCFWESGTYLPRATLLPKIAKLYNCSIDELLSDVDAPAE